MLLLKEKHNTCTN